MMELGEAVGVLTPEKSTGRGLFSSPVTGVTVFKNGVSLQRKRGEEQLLFPELAKITAKGYASQTPTSIETTLLPVSGKPVAFTLASNKRDVNLLLDVHCDFLLGPEFPKNLTKLDLELGGMGGTLRLTGGCFVIGGKHRIPMGALAAFTTNKNGFYEAALRGVKQKLAVSPDSAPNILASIKVLSVLVEMNKK